MLSVFLRNNSISIVQMLRPEEVELLVCGTDALDLNELRKATEYDGYRPDDSIIW